MTNTPRRDRLADGQVSSLYPPLTSFSSFGAAPVMLCCPALPACSSTPLPRSVHHPSVSLVVNIVCIQTFCDHLNVIYVFDQKDLYRFESRLELYGANACLVVRSLSLSPSHPLTPPPSRWPALTTLPPSPSFSSFGAAYVKLCCLPPPSLVRNTRLCCLIYV